MGAEDLEDGSGVTRPLERVGSLDFAGEIKVGGDGDDEDDFDYTSSRSGSSTPQPPDEAQAGPSSAAALQRAPVRPLDSAVRPQSPPLSSSAEGRADDDFKGFESFAPAAPVYGVASTAPATINPTAAVAAAPELVNDDFGAFADGTPEGETAPAAGALDAVAAASGTGAAALVPQVAIEDDFTAFESVAASPLPSAAAAATTATAAAAQRGEERERERRADVRG
jgi:hypothetical protein